MVDPRVLGKFSQKDPSSPVIFTGDQCVVTILQKMEETYNCVEVSDKVTTIGVFDMVVDGIQSGMFLVGRIEMHPSNIERVVGEDNTPLIQLTFKKGDIFIKSTNVVVESKLAFYVWLEYIKFAHTLKAMTYEQQAEMFDRMRLSTGITFPVDHVVYEVIMAHLSRSQDDFAIPYRNTDMKKDFVRIKFGDVAHAAKSTSARIIGAYDKEGIVTALVNAPETNSQIEDLLRS